MTEIAFLSKKISIDKIAYNTFYYLFISSIKYYGELQRYSFAV